MSLTQTIGAHWVALARYRSSTRHRCPQIAHDGRSRGEDLSQTWHVRRGANERNRRAVTVDSKCFQARRALYAPVRAAGNK